MNKLLVIVILLLCEFSFAQPPIQIYSTQGTFSPSYTKDQTYEYLVTFKSGVTRKCTGRMRKSFSKDMYFIKSEGSRIYVDQTICIKRVNKDTLTGVATGNKWLFTVLTGEITAYSLYPTENMFELTHVKKKDGPLYTVNASLKNSILPELIKDSPLAMKKWRKDQRIRWWKRLGPFAMIGVLGTIAVLLPTDNPVAIASELLIPVGIVVPLAKKRIHTAQIIEFYNTDKMLQKQRNYFKDDK